MPTAESLSQVTANPPVLRLHPADNVVVARRTLKAGTDVQVEGVAFGLAATIPAGHKIATTAIARGDRILKYGQTIGFARADISPGRYGAAAHCGWKTVREVSRGVNPFGENCGARVGAIAWRDQSPIAVG